MGACLSRKKCSPPPPPPLNNVPLSAVIEAAKGDSLSPELIVNKNLSTEEEEVKEEEKKQVAEEASPGKKEVFVVKHRKSYDRERPSVSKEEENNSNAVVRSSSCTKEEVDAILIQCGRLSRNNSSATPTARKYAGSKRSFDLDNDRDAVDYEPAKKATEEEIEFDRRQRHRRQTRSSPSQGRRRTPSRERDSASSGRRVSRSPGKRSQVTPAANSSCRLGKMVSVPATVESQAAKRVSVKRNGGEPAGMRAAASPRSQSPARMQSPSRRAVLNENNQPLLSRSSSRKAEQSPYRRNPLAEIDSNKPNNRAHNKNREAQVHHAVKEAINQGQVQKQNKVVASAGDAKSRPQTPTRSRIARRSRDFDFNPEPSTNPNPSYTALLLEDIQSFHQKNTNTNTGQSDSFPVPACLSKACSILEAVADLNSTTSSNRSCTFSGTPAPKLGNGSSSFVESEVEVSDDLREPSMHKYVTVRRGGEDLDGQESSGSNSFVHNWGFSADSTSRSTTRDDERSPLGFQKLVISEPGLKGQRAANGRTVVAVASM